MAATAARPLDPGATLGVRTEIMIRGMLQPTTRREARLQCSPLQDQLESEEAELVSHVRSPQMCRFLIIAQVARARTAARETRQAPINPAVGAC